MGLREYHAKRKFDRTPEPKGEEAPGRGALRFVVQKHQAKRLHYDFRLELGGTLKSWAVPKGPSLNPQDKRLAIMVEDHPLDYGDFEGVIPAGNYGAGTVMVWDQGPYHSPETDDRLASERLLEAGLAKGDLKFVLHGHKLKGSFALVRLKKAEANAWLLIKKQDAFSGTEDVLAQDRSAASQRTMEGIADHSRQDGAFWVSKGKKGRMNLDDAPKSPMPRNIKPMLATPVDQSFDKKGWLFEIKWDGYRAVAEVQKDKIRLYSRKLLPFETYYPPVVESLKKMEHNAVLDGEIVVLDDAGRSRFQLLQIYRQTKKGPLVYYVFDLLYLDGHDLRSVPLVRRKELLCEVLPDVPNIRLSEHVEEQGKAFFEAVAQQGLEGVVAKEAGSRYLEGKRAKSWLKIKTRLRQEAVVCGFTKPQGGRKHFGSLVLGVYEKGELVYIGRSGSGFTERSLADVRAKLEPLIQKECPFKKKPKTDSPATWVKPELVCEVNFATWTDDGHIREPIFQGLREDKPASSVRREETQDVRDVLKDKSRGTALQSRPSQAGSGDPAHVNLTNLTKLYWPDEGYTKGDLIDYYRQVADVILPYLKDRPQSLNRHPNGLKGKSFFQKDVSRQPPPPWVETIVLRGAEGDTTRFLLCQDQPSLLYMANLGCIEINPLNSRVGSLDRPDYMLIDLDPEDVPFDRVVEAAQVVHKTLDEVGAENVCKTSGKRGLHIYVPLGARYTHEQAKAFAELIVQIVHRQLPATTSLLRMPKQRQKKVYLDWIQNGEGKTLAAAYSARPYPGATVSTPLKWSEVKKGLDPARFTIRSLPKRLDKVGDLWKSVMSNGIDLPKCLERVANFLQRLGQKKI